MTHPTMIPIQQFRARHDLPATFSVALFEPKDDTGLGRIDTAGTALHDVRAVVLAALPSPRPAAAWLGQIPVLQTVFTGALHRINPLVGLREVEIDFAAAGFRDVCEAVVYARLRAEATRQPAPTFRQIYADWLDSTIRIGATIHEYTHRGETWGIQIISHAYGRAGLIVTLGATVQQVADPALGCPAAGFMQSLLSDVGARLLAAEPQS